MMTDMTPEERARKLTKLIVIGELAYDNSDPYAVIAQTIREAEDFAYRLGWKDGAMRPFKGD